MKHSIRTRFAIGIIFLFGIIILLAISSGYYLNQLSEKTEAILKENYMSVVYARDMTEGIRAVNTGLTESYLNKNVPDTMKLRNDILLIERSLSEEKRNITEPGEERLVADFERSFTEYDDSVKLSVGLSLSVSRMLFIQNRSEDLCRMLLLLSQINGKALENKTDAAKFTSKKALQRMTILATLSFIFGLSFAYNLVSYFNQRISQLHRGIKQIVSSNFDQRLYFEGKDEFYEISLVFNEMAEKLERSRQKMSVTLTPEVEVKSGLTSKESGMNEIGEMKEVILRLKEMEQKIEELILRFGKSK